MIVQLAKFLAIAIRNYPKNYRKLILVQQLCRNHGGQTLTPTFLEIILFGFQNGAKRAIKHHPTQRRSLG